MRHVAALCFVTAVLLFCSCENSSQKSTGDGDSVTDIDVSAEDEDSIVAEVEESPDLTQDDLLPDEDGAGETDFGYNVFFQVMTIHVFGQPMAMAFGLVMKTAREDLDPEEETHLPVDTCEFDSGETETPTPECVSDEECAPEQRCLPDTDNNGNPIAGTESCKTPDRESLDRGPVIITGFVGGPAIFLYEPNDQVYKKDGTGDGSIDIALLAFGIDYSLAGDGQGDLKPFSGEIFMPPSLELTYPELTTGGSLPFPTANIDPTKDVLIQWAEPNPTGEMDLTLTGESGSVICRVADDGEFIMPAELVSQITFGTGFNVMANNIILDRKFSSPMAGGSVTAGMFATEEMVNVMVNAVVSPDDGTLPDEDALRSDN